ncbi:hypothetical protein GCM10009613_40430 [Pseudonocardia kongjuensis]|uniref:Uncharacterized protein n=1 Tax=Pseudonocardia kongjuensis TaxID=102227 RepID=A0ABP4IQS8_9PSEU
MDTSPAEGDAETYDDLPKGRWGVGALRGASSSIVAPSQVRGLPPRTIQALDQVAEPELSAAAVADALDQWRWYIEIPVGPRRLEKDPYDEWVGESARIRLDAAVAALPVREARPLRRMVAALDRRFLSATVPDPSVPAGAPWWQRRDWF